MAHTVEEAKKMADAAREAGVATQVATGNTASEATRLLCEWVWDGAIGPVREVHNWSTRPFWPQGLARPQESQPVPSYLNWDLWLDPAPYRPFHTAYQPFIWRGWYDFGSSSIGDMGCYSFDTIFRVLKLNAPDRIEASSTEVFEESYPLASLVHFFFPARGDMPPVTLHWYDGRLRPPKPEEIGTEELPEEGLLFVGDKGKILCGFNGSRPRLIPETAMEAYQQPPQTLPRSIGHYEEWIAACQSQSVTPGANFETAQPSTEAILLGNVAVRTGQTLHWNAKQRSITTPGEANTYLHLPYRDGWML
jgi:predicted dehydrogenase